MTASGKSALAHKIAIERNLDIISLDSMAVYKGLDILTDKPTEVMRSQVLYYGIDIADSDQNFSVVDYLNYLIEMEIPEKSFVKDFLVLETFLTKFFLTFFTFLTFFLKVFFISDLMNETSFIYNINKIRVINLTHF